jgi:uncharacterized protein YndB with AHSA1/START domain
VAEPVIDFTGSYEFGVPPDELWRAIEQFDRFPRWWSWLGQFRVDGPGLEAGTVLHGVVAPPLPYRMRVTVRLLRCEPPWRIDASVEGELTGPASLEVTPTEQGSRVEVTWALEMQKPAMRAVARVALPLLRFAHDRVVEATVAGFRRHLGGPP